MACDVEKMRKDLSVIKKEVDSAFDKVFSGNNRINKGLTDNHCNKKTLDYFVGLYKGSQESLDRQKKILEELEKVDFNDIQQNVLEILNEQ